MKKYSARPIASPGSLSEPPKASNACAYGVSNKFFLSYQGVSFYLRLESKAHKFRGRLDGFRLLFICCLESIFGDFRSSDSTSGTFTHKIDDQLQYGILYLILMLFYHYHCDSLRTTSEGVASRMKNFAPDMVCYEIVRRSPDAICYSAYYDIRES